MTRLLFVFGIALLVRLIHVWQLQASPFFSVLLGDSRAYDEWAQRIAAGDWLGREVFYQAPLYPYFLGALYAVFGRDLLLVRLVQAALGSAACVFLALAAARLFSARVGFVSGLILALYAPAIFFDALIQKSVLDVFLVCLALWIISGILDAPKRSSLWLALGVTLGTLTLSRENALLLVVVMLAWALSKRVALPNVAAFAIGLGLVLMPVAARNQHASGGFVLTTSQFGPNFYMGNNPNATGTYMALREGRGDPRFERADATELAEAALGRRLSATDVSDYWRDLAFGYIASDPIEWMQLTGRKLLLLVSATEMVDTESQASHAEWSPILRVAGYFGHFGVWLPLAVVGLAATWSARSRLWLVYALAVGYAASVVMFFVVARYRYPLVPFVVLFAAAGICALPRYVGVRKSSSTAQRRDPLPHVAVVAIAVIMIVVVSRWPVLASDTMQAITETNLGATLQEQGRIDEAIVRYRRAIEIRPDYAPAHNNLGAGLRKQGRLDEAVASYRRALELFPEDAGTHYNVATALVEQRHSAEAVSHFEKAFGSIRPSAAAHNNFGVALVAAGRFDEAVGHFRKALELEPDARATLRNLGDALARLKQYPEAVSHLRRVTELHAQDPGAHYDLGGVLLEAGQPTEAARAFREAIRLAPDSAQAYDKLGIALASQGQMNEAIAAFQQAVRLQPDYAEAQRHLRAALGTLPRD